MELFGVTERQEDKFRCSKCYSQVYIDKFGLITYTDIKDDR